MSTAGIEISPDDLARVVDAECKGALGREGIIERDERSAGKEKAVKAAGIGETAYDLA